LTGPVLNRELRSVSSFLAANKSEVVVLAFAALMLTLANYRPLWNHWSSSLFYYLLLPISMVRIVCRNPLDFGLRMGRVKAWSPYVAVACLLMAPVLIAASRFASFQTYYVRDNFDLVQYAARESVYLLGWEYMFRGFLLFGLKERLKEASILVQALPFVLLHFDKPELETVSTIATGVLFGYIAYRAGSFWPAYFIHLFINVFFLALVNLT